MLNVFLNERSHVSLILVLLEFTEDSPNGVLEHQLCLFIIVSGVINHRNKDEVVELGLMGTLQHFVKDIGWEQVLVDELFVVLVESEADLLNLFQSGLIGSLDSADVLVDELVEVEVQVEFSVLLDGVFEVREILSDVERSDFQEKSSKLCIDIPSRFHHRLNSLLDSL